MSKDIVKKPDTAVVSGVGMVQSMIQQAIDKGVPVETLERLLAMMKDAKAQWAKEQFDKAMATFQNKCGVIKKTKKVSTNSGTKAYSYAPLESIVEQVKDLLNKNGFSYAIQTRTEDKSVVAICTAKHVDGHSESSDMKVPLGTKTQMMSDTQVVAAALTFAKRYAFCNVFGILTGDEDTNAPAAKSDNPREGFDKAAARMRACKSVDSLNSTWRSLPANLRADDELIALGKELKRKLS